MSSNAGQSFIESYSEKWPFIRKSRLGSQYAHCDKCITDFSIKHGGKNDVVKHIGRSKHAKNVLCMEGVTTLETFVNKPLPSSESDVTNAECLMTNFIIEHNLPVSVSDHMTDLIKSMCPDSNIAKSYQCKRTKTTHIVHEMSRDIVKDLHTALVNEPFSISTDGSESKSKQLYPILLRYPDKDLQKVVTKLISLSECKDACTGENIFKLLDNCVSKHSDWDQCIALSVDNASTMTGLMKGLAGRILRKQSQVFVIGCTCHLVHLAAGKAAAKLPIKLEDLLIDIYFYLEKSHKRHILLEEFQHECGTDVQAILKHVATRWLSLEKCIIRLLVQWDPLTKFFTKEILSIKPKQKKTIVEKATANLKKSESKDNNYNKQKTIVDKATAILKKSDSKEKNENKKKRSADTTVDQDTCTQSKKVKPSSSKKSLSSETKEMATTNHAPGPTLTESLKASNVDRVHRVFYLLTDKRTKLYCFFLESTLPVFNSMNLLLQRDDPCIHKLHDACLNLLTDIYIRFVLPMAVMKIDCLPDVKYRERINQKDRDDIMIGSKTRAYLNECRASKSIDKEGRTEFFDSVREYFCTAADYVIEKFPINKDFVLHAEVADVKNKCKSNFESIKFFVNYLPSLSDIRDNYMDELELEYLRYQVKEIPPELSSLTIRIDTV